MAQGLELLSLYGFNIKTVLDVGASNGSWSKECLKFFPKSNYVLFEPQPIHNDALNLFVKSNEQVRVIKKAVGASEGYTFFDASDEFGGALASSGVDDNAIKVEMTTLDASVFQLQVAPSYLIKLDTHGFERSILQGAGSVIDKTEILIIEAYNYRITDEAFLFWELCAYLADKGFRPVDLVDVLHRQYDNSLWQMDLLFIKDDWKGFSYLSYK